MEEIKGNNKMQSEKNVSMEEAKSFLEMKKKDAGIIANAVFMCIISPAVLIFLAGAEDDGRFSITESFAAGAGLVFLFGMVAVYMFIMCGLREKSMVYLEKEDFEIGDSALEMVKQKRESYIPLFAKGIATGVVLCILAVLPLILAGIMEAPDYICCIFTSVLLLIIAVGVNIIIRVSVVKASYDTLLQEGEFSKEGKKEKRKIEALTSIYWCLITAIYLGWSFWTTQWNITWMVWPVAGVLYAAISGIAKLVMRDSGKE